jgi:hypothetical protein
MSRNTPTCRMWYCDRVPPDPPDALRIAAARSPQQLGGRDPQSSAFFRGPAARGACMASAAEMQLGVESFTFTRQLMSDRRRNR